MGVSRPPPQQGMHELFGRIDYFCSIACSCHRFPDSCLWHTCQCEVAVTHGCPRAISELDALLPTSAGFSCFAQFRFLGCSSQVRLGGWFTTKEWERRGSTDWSPHWISLGLRPLTEWKTLNYSSLFHVHQHLIGFELLFLLVQPEQMFLFFSFFSLVSCLLESPVQMESGVIAGKGISADTG